MDDALFDGLREKLNMEHYPMSFVFKFVFPKDQLEEVKALFPATMPFQTRPSKEGKYLSYTCSPLMSSTESIIDVYKKAALIKGVISL